MIDLFGHQMQMENTLLNSFVFQIKKLDSLMIAMGLVLASNLNRQGAWKIHLWRIASECLPWLDKQATQCPLCRVGTDGAVYLSIECFFGQVAWRESPWKLWSLPLATNAPTPLNLTELVCKPPFFPQNSQDVAEFFFFLFLDQFCSMKIGCRQNRCLHEPKYIPDIEFFLRKIHKSDVEHLHQEADACLVCYP